jgi:hypothetical protein
LTLIANGFENCVIYWNVGRKKKKKIEYNFFFGGKITQTKSELTMVEFGLGIFVFVAVKKRGLSSQLCQSSKRAIFVPVSLFLVLAIP